MFNKGVFVNLVFATCLVLERETRRWPVVLLLRLYWLVLELCERKQIDRGDVVAVVGSEISLGFFRIISRKLWFLLVYETIIGGDVSEFFFALPKVLIARELFTEVQNTLHMQLVMFHWVYILTVTVIVCWSASFCGLGTALNTICFCVVEIIDSLSVADCPEFLINIGISGWTDRLWYTISTCPAFSLHGCHSMTFCVRRSNTSRRILCNIAQSIYIIRCICLWKQVPRLLSTEGWYIHFCFL